MKNLFVFFVSLSCVSGMLTGCSSDDDGGDKKSSRDIYASGCLDTRSDDEVYEEPEPYIVLAKEGGIVSCELHNFEYHCFVYDFDVVTELNRATDGMDSLYMKVIRVTTPYSYDFRCRCHYNINFVIRDVMSDEMRFHCWVPNRNYDDYDGVVSFKESSIVVLNLMGHGDSP